MTPSLTLTDGRGKRSKTLFFVTITWVVLLFKFLFAGANLPILGAVPDMTANEFGLAFGLIVGVWVGREWKEKDLSRGTR